MRRLKLISKYFLRNAIEETFSNKKGSPIKICLIMLFAMICISMPFVSLVTEGFDILSSTGSQGVLINMFIFLGTSFTFLFGINNVLNIFYFSKDIEHILPLPFKSSEVIFGKFLSVLVSMYVYSSIIILPLVAYGIVSKASPIFYLYVIIAFLVNPIVPLIISSLISMVLMRFTNLSKHKDAFRMITGILLLVVVIAFSYFNQKANTSIGNNTFMISAKTSTFLTAVNNILISNKFMCSGLINNTGVDGALLVLIAVIINIALFIIYYIVGGSLYYKGVIGVTETFSKRENVFDNGKVDKIIRRNSKLKALIKKDLRVLMRTPKFFINGVAMLFYMPIILGIAFLNDNFSKIISGISSDVSIYGYVIVVIFLFSIFGISSGGAAITAVSREGKDFKVSKFIPVDVNTQVLAKIGSSVIVNEISTLIVIAIMVYLKIPTILIILGTIVSILSVIALSIIEVWMDFNDPKLDWDSEADIFRKNFLPLILMGITLVLAIGLFTLVSIIHNYIYIFSIIIVIDILAAAISYSALRKSAYRLYLEN